MTKALNIVSFDVPYPPNYGGVIDVYYKIKSLSEAGITIHLHTFEYGRGIQSKLEEICETVTYYPRNKSLKNYISRTPFIVKSRYQTDLIENLNNNAYPVLFEGIHTTFGMEQISAKKYIRTHNIEHIFFKGQAKNEKKIFKKLFFLLESYRLKQYEKILFKPDRLFTISPFEQEYFNKNYQNKADYIPAFHNDNFKQHKSVYGKYILWHGDLRVSDNIKIAHRLIKIFKDTAYQLILASSFQETSISKKINKFQNINFTFIKNKLELDNLLENAHINILLTTQKSGIKLKLLYSLYQGKHIICNNKMIEDTGLESLCIEANTNKEIIQKTNLYFEKAFDETIIERRKKILSCVSPKKSAQKIIEVIF